MDAEFEQYQLKAGMVCLGERIKKGTFRPSATTIASTQIAGALRHALGRDDLWAIGYLQDYAVEYHVFAPRDVVTGISKIPLLIQILTDVTGLVFIRHSGRPLPREFPIILGAFKSKGLGACKLTRRDRSPDMAIREGALRSRLPEDEGHWVGIHGDKDVIQPRYGYLFLPQQSPDGAYTTAGTYQRALFEDSIVRAHGFIVR